MTKFLFNGNDFKKIINQAYIRRNPVCYSYVTEIRDVVKKSYFRFDFSKECSKLNNNVYDTRIKLLDYHQISKTYEENKIIQSLEKRSKLIAGELKEISSDNISGFLFIQNYPGIKLNCLNRNNGVSSKNNFLFTEEGLRKIQNIQSFLFCEFLSILFNGVFIVIEIIIFKYNWMKPREIKEEFMELREILDSYEMVKKIVVLGFFF